MSGKSEVITIRKNVLEAPILYRCRQCAAVSAFFSNFAAMKILFAGDFSGYHAALADELRRRGHTCTVVSDGNRYMDTGRDITLSRKPGLIGSFKYLYDAFSALGRMRGYDVVQLVNAHFLALKPGKLSYFLRQLKRENGRLFLSLCSTDHFYAKAMTEGKTLDYSEYGVQGRPTDFTLHCEREINGWLMPVCKAWAEQVYGEVDGAVSALYEYHKVWEPVFGSRLRYVGIGVDTSALPFRMLESDGPLKVMVGIKPETARSKGIYLLQQALSTIAGRHPDRIRLVEVCRKPLAEYLRIMESCGVVADQIYSYTPATNALQAMALGKVVISGGEEDYYNFIGEKNLRPIINADPRGNDLVSQLEPLLLDREALVRRSAQGRELVCRHNDIRIVTDRLLAAWREI